MNLPVFLSRPTATVIDVVSVEEGLLLNITVNEARETVGGKCEQRQPLAAAPVIYNLELHFTSPPRVDEITRQSVQRWLLAFSPLDSKCTKSLLISMNLDITYDC